MKLASFDIEICDELNTSDPTFVPRISCAAVALSDSEQLTFWANPNAPDMTPEIVQQMFSDLLDLASRGYTILTWNGVAFDFKVVEHYAGVYAKQVQQMSWDAHVDMMLLVAFQKGHRLGLDAALKSANVTLGKFFGPPTETNFAGGYLTGSLADVQAAALAFTDAIAMVVQTPMSGVVRPERERR